MSAQLALDGLEHRLRPGYVSTAVFSADRKYRYRLVRVWDPSRPLLALVMLNGSTADELGDDPTIRCCIALARREGFGGIIVRNLYAAVATDPRELTQIVDPVGPANDAELALCGRHLVTVLAWGAHADPVRARQVAQMLAARCHDEGTALAVLGWTKAGQPRHPLYLPAATALQRHWPRTEANSVDERWQTLAGPGQYSAPAPAPPRDPDDAVGALRAAQRLIYVRGCGIHDAAGADLDVTAALAAVCAIPLRGSFQPLRGAYEALAQALPRPHGTLRDLPRTADAILDAVLQYEINEQSTVAMHDWITKAITAAEAAAREFTSDLRETVVHDVAH
ncbi:Uncharacterized protein conserved in bacteria [Mycobacteroides abscessus subsp. abscessus]|uniref:DUF1643 domain-containing protein n=1 Tax=Mycobacteroides abscessus TaxID=36809 RepID=UPI00092AD6C4|nr:DUF1643 domain-containing protein [Mycobacteroides abscessus]SIJ20565.1 Uncharacterized protein conserved in bacteria [Mycobacteroides abscessus subsp. abscessus]SLH39698.1 Uncharacterized protein conserved in bacteria [Mycobacteroides abscessus subsp. abscessus]